MGKATILGGGTDGEYTIQIDYGSSVRLQRIAALNARISQLSAQATAQSSAYEAQLSVVNASNVTLNEAIDAYVVATKTSSDPETYKDELAAYKAAAARLKTEQGKAYALKVKLDQLNSEISSANQEAGAWTSLNLSVTQAAWCADFTEDATGEVATIDIPGESSVILVAPGGPAPAPIDGVLVAREVQSPAQVFFNAAVLPGVQKFKPNYRLGTITALNQDTDKADVSLDPAYSSAQGLPINIDGALSNVPVEYMTCNAQAFEVGDRCVVRFDGDWSAPKVIGFRDNPRPCWPEEFYANLEAPVEIVTDGEYFWMCWLKSGDEILVPCDEIENKFLASYENRLKIQVNEFEIPFSERYPSIEPDPDNELVLLERTSLDDVGQFKLFTTNITADFFRVVTTTKAKGGAGTFVLSAASNGSGGCTVLSTVSGYSSSAAAPIDVVDSTTPIELFDYLNGADLPSMFLKNTNSDKTKEYLPDRCRKDGSTWQVVYRRIDLVEG